MKDNILEKIADVLKKDKSVSGVETYTNVEYDKVIKYEQGGEKYLITIEQL